MAVEEQGVIYFKLIISKLKIFGINASQLMGTFEFSQMKKKKV